MVILKKRELDYLSSSTDFVNKDFRRLSLNIVVLFIALIVISNIAVFRLSKIQANSLKKNDISEYEANIASDLLNKKTNLTIGDKSEMEVLTMEDLTVKPKYISNSIGKLTIIGSIFLMVIAVLPVLVSKYSGLPSSVTIGGTGILIVVGVAIETYKQMESSLLARSYKEKRKRLR